MISKLPSAKSILDKSIKDMKFIHSKKTEDAVIEYLRKLYSNKLYYSMTSYKNARPIKFLYDISKGYDCSLKIIDKEDYTKNGYIFKEHWMTVWYEISGKQRVECQDAIEKAFNDYVKKLNSSWFTRLIKRWF